MEKEMKQRHNGDCINIKNASAQDTKWSENTSDFVPACKRNMFHYSTVINIKWNERKRKLFLATMKTKRIRKQKSLCIH